MLRWPDGRIKPLLFDSSPLLPSAVFAAADGRLIVGRDALHHARFAPASLEPNPKRRIDEDRVLLGEREVEVTDLVTAVLRYVYQEAVRVTGGTVPAVALAHPAGWGPVRRLVLADAARAAGLGEPTFIPEPAAAAHYFTAVLGHRIPPSGALAVYDFGAGTFDASVVRRSGGDFEVLAVDGLDDVGGVDVDAAIVDWLRAGSPAESAPIWARLGNPTSAGDARERHLMWEEVRTGKELLSRSASIELRLPLQDRDVPLTRDEFDRIAGPLVERTVRTSTALLRHARLTPADLAGLFLVGGSSRIPLVATALHRALSISPVLTEQPELVVAEGALHSRGADRAAVAGATADSTTQALQRPPAAATAVAQVAAPPRQRPAEPPVGRAALSSTLTLPVTPGHDDDDPTRGHQQDNAPPWHPPRRRGVAGRIALAVILTAVLVISLGLNFGAIKLPGFASSPPGGTGAAPDQAGTTPSAAVVPAGWSRVRSDPLSSRGAWTDRNDPQATSDCTVEGALTAGKQTSGTYRCPGPETGYGDVAVLVDVTLRTEGVCGGIWLRFGLSQLTNEQAGYLVKVCPGGYTVAQHGHPQSNKITDLRFFPTPARLGERTRVGVVAAGATIAVYRDGKRLGQVDDGAFPLKGRMALGVVVPAPVTAGGHTVSFSNVEIYQPAA
jgi:hypothetical protein